MKALCSCFVSLLMSAKLGSAELLSPLVNLVRAFPPPSSCSLANASHRLTALYFGCWSQCRGPAGGARLRTDPLQLLPGRDDHNHSYDAAPPPPPASLSLSLSLSPLWESLTTRWGGLASEIFGPTKEFADSLGAILNTIGQTAFAFLQKGAWPTEPFPSSWPVESPHTRFAFLPADAFAGRHCGTPRRRVRLLRDAQSGAALCAPERCAPAHSLVFSGPRFAELPRYGSLPFLSRPDACEVQCALILRWPAVVTRS